MNRFIEVEFSPGVKRIGLQVDGYVTMDSTQIIAATAQGILDARALYPEMTLAQMYDEKTMPPELRVAHALNDRAVTEAYGFEPDDTEADIVAGLMEMYNNLVQNEGGGAEG